MAVDQIMIAFTGVTAIFLSQDRRESVRKYACLFGLCAQPFWFYTAFAHEQWGIFALAFLYTFSWLRGVWAFWIQPRFSGSAR